jgi:hypothetical protein
MKSLHRLHSVYFAAQKLSLSGQSPSILLRKTVRSLKSPTGAFIAALRFANASLPMAGRAGSSCKQRKTGSSHLLGIRKTVFEK